MSTRAPQAIWDLWYATKKAIPRAQLGGIVGDSSHLYGYHLARDVLPASDYSVCQRPEDRQGPGDTASAIDITLPPDLMKICTGRLLKAAKAGDSRLAAVREFCGTLDGRNTYPWDLPSNSSEGLNTWDSGHLTHIHISILRKYDDTSSALLPIAEVLAGTPLERFAAKVSRKSGFPYSPLSRQYFGPLNGPARSHGGANPEERPYVRFIQVRLAQLGAAPTDGSWKPNGRYGPGTEAAVKRWQAKTHQKQTGVITAAGWKALVK